jgi:hypothetical protein
MLAPGRIYAGSQVDIPVKFQTSADADVDPTTVVATTLDPAGTETSYTYGTDTEVTKQSVGDYTLRITATMPGRWRYRWLTTGTGTVVALEGSFNVQASGFVDDAFDIREDYV